jgi:hypothetical protein
MNGVRHRVHEFTRRRNLGGNRRAGQFSRRQGWTHVADFIRRYWLVLLITPVGISLAFLPLILLLNGVARGVVLGTALSSGVWVDAIIVLVWTGASTKFMGANGEVWTAEVLRRLSGDGWRLVNGLRLNARIDIDHVVLGPGGVLAVESKWSANPWPLNSYGPKFMEGQLKNAAQRAQEAARDLREWFSESIPVTSVAVFWSGAERQGSGWTTWRDGHTVLVHGPDLQQWLGQELPGGSVKPETIDRAWAQLKDKIDEQDRIDQQSGASPLPTVWEWAFQWILKPMIGIVLAIYGLWLTRFTHSAPAIFGITVLFVAVGILGLKSSAARNVAIGWTISSVALMIFEVGILAKYA